MRVRFDVHLLCLSVLLSFHQALAARAEGDHTAVREEEVLARIGARTITARDLRERIELTPWPGKDNPGTRDSAKVYALFSLVAEKLLAMQAAEQGIVNSAGVPELRVLERVLARDELFKQEITKNVVIDDSEIRKGLVRYASRVTVHALRMDSEQSARKVAQLLQQRMSTGADALLQKSILSRDTITVTFGDLPSAYEDAIYSLDSLQLCRVADLPGIGWVVLQFVQREPNPAFVRATIDQRRHAVRERIRKLQEHALVSSYSRNAFQSKIAMDSSLFLMLGDTLRTLMKSSSHGAPRDGAFVLSQNEIEALKQKLALAVDRPFITADNRTISLGIMIEELNYHQVTFSSLKRRDVLETLNRTLPRIADAALASELAIEQKMHHKPDVQRDVQTWADALAAERMFTHLCDSVERRRGAVGDVKVGEVTSEDIAQIRRFIAMLAEKFRVEINLESFKGIEVNPINFVTKRFIGFGGTMLARPMLRPLWGWSSYWNSARDVTP